MTSLTTTGHLLPAQSLVHIDWPTLLEQRPAILKHTDVPPYLILPEVHQLLDDCRHDNTHLLLNTLWHTGARVSESLALTRESFNLSSSQPYVSLDTLKTRGRPKKGSPSKPRLVPIADTPYLRQVDRYLTTHQVKKNERLFNITRGAVNKRIDRLIDRSRTQMIIDVSPHTFRHSFAVNAILHGTPLPVLQGWLGHAHIESTIIYTQVLSLETHHFIQRIQF